jgi:lycopene beta-cyclase
MDNKHYDYIIAGGGCAGLSLAYYIAKSKALSDKSILIIDKQFEKTNDRTWCFWEPLQDEGLQKLISKKWDQLKVADTDFEKVYDTSPFTYNKINGIDFYDFILEELKKYPQITFLEQSIDTIDKNGIVSVGGDSYVGGYVFNSILQYDPNQFKSIDSNIENSLFHRPFLWQQFIGYSIQFDQPILDEYTATWMDFNVDQLNDTAFMYVLPESKNTALFEYTLFSKSIEPEEVFKSNIVQYLKTHFPNTNYTIIHQEQGIIPMSVITPIDTSKVISIGTIGGAVKPSTGFAFSFIQRQTAKMVSLLEQHKSLVASIHTRKYQFFDKVFINVLDKKNMSGKDLFVRIFKANNIQTVFRFLSNTSSLWEDLLIMNTLPKRKFLKSAIEVLFKRD